MHILSYKVRLQRHLSAKSLRAKGFKYRAIGKIFRIDPSAAREIIITPPKKHFNSRSDFTHIGYKSSGGREHVRMQIRLRDRFTCQDCGKKRTFAEVKLFNSKKESLKGRIKLFDVHHLNGQCGSISRGYDNVSNISNLITLCHKCHYAQHDHRAYGKYHQHSKKVVHSSPQ